MLQLCYIADYSNTFCRCGSPSRTFTSKSVKQSVSLKSSSVCLSKHLTCFHNRVHIHSLKSSSSPFALMMKQTQLSAFAQAPELAQTGQADSSRMSLPHMPSAKSCLSVSSGQIITHLLSLPFPALPRAFLHPWQRLRVNNTQSEFCSEI